MHTCAGAMQQYCLYSLALLQSTPVNGFHLQVVRLSSDGGVMIAGGVIHGLRIRERDFILCTQV